MSASGLELGGTNCGGMSETKRVIAILGCTASGKGSLARELARRLHTELVSVDSMKVYRRMDIGTAKPALDERRDVPHHLLDVVEPWEPFSAARFVELADAAIDAIHARGRPAIVVGGTVLYFNCLYKGLFAGPSADPVLRARLRQRAEREGLDALHADLATVDPDAARRIHRNDLRRIERALEVHELTGVPISRLQREWNAEGPRRADWNWTLLGLRCPTALASRRINDRVRRMVALGLVQEARRLWSDPRGVSAQAAQAVGYAELFAHFRGEIALEDALEAIKVNSRRLAKHQRSWLKRFDAIRWLETNEGGEAAALVESVLSLLRDEPGA
ncbi:MAG: tRNA dimethylallyltransferase [Phycisphaerae bacterium]|nr:tRNA dimethylallyltransferase [Phycisphaerae bacterium]